MTTIENQGEKQIKAIQDQRQAKTTRILNLSQNKKKYLMDL